MRSFLLNGGFIGPTVEYSDTDRHIVGTTQVRLRPTYVAGTTEQIQADTVNEVINLPANLLQNDLVVVALAIAGTTDKTYRISGYTQVVDLYANDDFDANLQVGYKFMGATPDTTVTITGGTGSGVDGGAIAIHVWRGIDTTTPLDVTTTTITQTNTGIPNPPAITPTTANSVVLVAAASAHNGGNDTYTATQLANFLTVGEGGDTNDATVGLGSFDWVSGAFDPNAFTWSQGDQTTYSTASCSLALRPTLTTVPVFGNFKSSGIWSLTANFDDRFYNTTVPGQTSYSLVTPGTYYFPVPPGLTEISAVCIGGGGGGGGGETGRNEGVTGGAGGGLAYGTFPVTPGEVLTVVVGAGGTGGASSSDGNAGGASTISRGATVLLSGGGGQGGLERDVATRTGGASTGTERDGGGAGGNSGGNSTDTGSGGGGAGGYTGNGGNGGTTGAGSNGAGGGGGGGGATNAGRGYGGGGTGWIGSAENGVAGGFNAPGTGGSGGGNASGPDGGYPGGGGGGCDDDTNGAGGNGGNGAVRIIWGNGRSYPNTNTGDV